MQGSKCHLAVVVESSNVTYCKVGAPHNTSPHKCLVPCAEDAVLVNISCAQPDDIEKKGIEIADFKDLTTSIRNFLQETLCIDGK